MDYPNTEQCVYNALSGVTQQLNINPNLITGLNIIVATLVGYSIIQGNYTIALLLSIIHQVLDDLDGAVARQHNRTSTFGAWFDYIGDFYFWGLIFVSLYIRCPAIVIQAILVYLALIISGVVSDNCLLVNTLYLAIVFYNCP